LLGVEMVACKSETLTPSYGHDGDRLGGGGQC